MRRTQSIISAGIIARGGNWFDQKDEVYPKAGFIPPSQIRGGINPALQMASVVSPPGWIDRAMCFAIRRKKTRPAPVKERDAFCSSRLGITPPSTDRRRGIRT